MLIDLTSVQVEEAITRGKALKDASLPERVKEWVAEIDPKIGYATVDTRFKEIARVARTLSLQGKEMSPEKVRAILGNMPRGNLYFCLPYQGD